MYKQDKSKTKYATKFFTLYLTEDKIQTAIIEKAPVAWKPFLVPPEVDEHITDIVGDQKALKFLKMKDGALSSYKSG